MDAWKVYGRCSGAASSGKRTSSSTWMKPSSATTGRCAHWSSTSSRPASSRGMASSSGPACVRETPSGTGVIQLFQLEAYVTDCYRKPLFDFRQPWLRTGIDAPGSVGRGCRRKPVHHRCHPGCPDGCNQVHRASMCSPGLPIGHEAYVRVISPSTRLFDGADLEDLGAADLAGASSCGSTVLHRDLLGGFDLALGLALHAVAHRCRGGDPRHRRGARRITAASIGRQAEETLHNCASAANVIESASQLRSLRLIRSVPHAGSRGTSSRSGTAPRRVPRSARRSSTSRKLSSTFAVQAA